MTTASTQPMATAPAPASAPVDVTGVEKHGYLFGKKLTHSLSPFLHGTIYRELGLNWAQFRFDSSDISHFLQLARDPNFYGASITMPNKVAILPYLDYLTPECLSIGACNTLYLQPSPDNPNVPSLCGTNTDIIGIRESFLQNIPNPTATLANRPALVIGGGGAARSAVYALRKWLGVTDIYLVNRDRREVEAVVAECIERGYGKGLRVVETVGEAEELEGPGAIVACIPDFPPVTQDEIKARAVMEVFLKKERKGAMLEMCYNPSPDTELGRLAERAGWQVILGTEAMIYQGLEQDKYWTGKEVSELPIEVVKKEVLRKLEETRSR